MKLSGGRDADFVFMTLWLLKQQATVKMWSVDQRLSGIDNNMYSSLEKVKCAQNSKKNSS